MRIRVEQPRHSGETRGRARAPIEQESFASQLVDQRHADHENTSLVAPMAIACWSPEIWLKPAAPKMSLM